MNLTHLVYPRLVAAIGLLAGLTLTARAAEVVILKDGFVIQGNVRKEVTTINDKASGKTFTIAKANGFNLIDEGPKIWIFSTHAKQLGEVSKDVSLRPEYKAYKRDFIGRKSSEPLPTGAVTKSSTEYNEKWLRSIKVSVPEGWELIEQQITYIDPYFLYMVSPTHLWRTTYRTSEMDPQKIRALLKMHPDLSEPDGKPDAAKRIALAKFMLDVGWLQLAKDDLESIRKTFPEGVPASSKEAYESLAKEIDVATAALVNKEAELALGAGRYGYAGDLLGVFPEKLATPKQTDDMTKLKAQWKLVSERFENGRRLLRGVLDEVTGLSRARPALAVTGGYTACFARGKELPATVAALVDAGEMVLAELHPDSAQRIEVFVNLAIQAEKEKLQGRDPTKRPEELLAAAVSGWAKGRNGATEKPELALRVWAARTAVLDFQRSNDLNTRNEILYRYKKGQPVSISELAQIISLLPPAQPENLFDRTGTPVAGPDGKPTGIYKRKTLGNDDRPAGIPYYVKLPPEYHHGRAYPVIIALTHPSADPEEMMSSLVYEADRHGYILLAPDWSSEFKNGWQWRGNDHVFVTEVLRDAIRHFCVDNDRVFLMGAADGANMAMDVGMSHPDLFAGVLAMGPLPKWQNMFAEYWRNAQKLPFYVVTGEVSGNSILHMRQIFEKWMPRGYPGLMAVYKGRGIEWYAAEVPSMFDWMGRKKRVNGAALLNLGGMPREPWTTMRTTDNRFYWLGADKISSARLIDNTPAGKLVGPATIQGDIKGNQIRLTTVGVTRASVWLTQDMIDWSKPVSVSVNNAPPPGYNKAKVLEQDLQVLLEDYRDRGDRRVLVLNRLEFSNLPP